MRTVPLTPDALSAGWRVALAAARGALAANAHTPTPTLDDEEIHARTQQLVHERDEVERLLEADARMEHVRLVRHLALPTATKDDLGQPDEVNACLFELDGVLTTSADLHFAAWAEAFDDLLARRLDATSAHFSHYARFSRRDDYDEHVAGKPRIEGARALLSSRGITLPEGQPDDPPEAETVNGLANRKNAALRRRLDHEGIAAFTGSRRYLEAAAAAGLATAVVSASAHTRSMLERAGLTDLVDVTIDGAAMSASGLEPKPSPDTLIAACELLGTRPERAAAFETTTAGLRAARTAGARLVVHVTRDGGDPAPAGLADVSVRDLANLLQPRLRGAA